MTEAGLENELAVADAGANLRAESPSAAMAWLSGGLRTFVLFLGFGVAVLVFAFLTVFQGRESQLPTHPGAMRSHATITYWQQHGYFYSGGLIHLGLPWRTNGPREIFWRSATGAYMISGYVVEQLVRLFGGRYSYRALAIHNEIITLISSALLALLAFQLLVGLGVDRLHSLIFSAASQLVLLSFPDSLSQYWEIMPQMAAMPFALLFLIFDRRQTATRRDLVLQGLSAFALVYTEYVFGILLFATWWLLRLLVDTRPVAWRRLLAVTVLPAVAAVVVFAAQVTINRSHYPDIPLEGTGFLVRSGLDGSSQYYGEHADLIYGRNVARLNFPANRGYLFTWRWLFIAGCAAVALLIVAAARYRALRSVIVTLGALIGAYVLYAAVFSEAVVIHPYEYDYLLAVPLIAAVFSFVPGLIEFSLPTKGIATTVVVLLTAWYAMVEMRNYSLRYPLIVPAKAAAASAAPAAEQQNGIGEWTSVAYSPANFSVDSGSIQLTAADQTMYRYAMIGTTMILSVNVQLVTVSGSPKEIRIAIPNGKAATGITGGAALVNNNGVWVVSRYYTLTDSRSVAVLPAAVGGSFANCRRCIYLHFTAMFEVK